MTALLLALLILGAIFFVLALIPRMASVNWVAAGLLCWILTVLIPQIK